MEKQSVEDSFKRAFHEAEMRPSEDVWTHIELDIEKEAGAELRKRVFYYRWTAAASIVLALSFLGIGYYFKVSNQSQSNQVSVNTPRSDSENSPSLADIDRNGSTAENSAQSGLSTLPEANSDAPASGQSLSNTTTQDSTPGSMPQNNYNRAQPSDSPLHAAAIPGTSAPGSSFSGSDKTGSSSKDVTVNSSLSGTSYPNSPVTGSSATGVSSAVALQHTTKQTGVVNEATQQTSTSSALLAADNQKEDRMAPQLTIRTGGPLPPLVTQRPYKLYFPKTEPDQIDLLLASIEMEEKEAKKERSNKETLWTSVSMAAGAYLPVNTSSAPMVNPQSSGGAFDFSRTSSGVANQVDAGGYSFSSGLSMGGKVAERWTLQGGVNYLAQNSRYSSDAVVVDGSNKYSLASLNNISEFSNVQSSVPYVVTSTLKYFNIPLQAGYLIVNKAFGWQVQGGISTDFFLQNTLAAEDSGLARVTQNSGDNSPYRTVNFSGLFGTEVSYRFGDHYRVALNPGIRYPFQSIYKSDLDISSSPITFDVGLKFHYIFR